jgi:DNA-binding transcriptional ArsR family regulator
VRTLYLSLERGAHSNDRRGRHLERRSYTNPVALTDDITDPRLAKALAHPLRLEILRVLGDRTASPSEIAAQIGAPLTNVSYHVRKLRSLGLIKLVRKTPKRGVIEHYYSAKPRRTVTDQAWAGTPAIVKEAIISPMVERIAKTMIEAAGSGGFERHNAHFTDNLWKLDEKAWNEASKVLHEAHDAIQKIEREAGERLASGSEEPITVASLISLYELPQPVDGSSPPPAAARPRRSRARSGAT